MWIKLDISLTNEGGAEISEYEAHQMLKLALFNLPPEALEAEDGSRWSVFAAQLAD